MKKTILVLSSFFMVATSYAQKEVPVDYMRSSLYTIILDDDGLMDAAKASVIKEHFISAPIPEKYNDHNLGTQLRSFKTKSYPVTLEEIAAYNQDGKPKKKESGFKSITKSITSSASAGLVDTTDVSKLPAVFNKFFVSNKVPQLMIAKWYDYSNDKYNAETKSYFDMELIKTRGLYNANEFDKSIADKSARGLSLLADAGEKLINNTFVVGVRFNYVDKAEVANQLKSTVGAIAGAFGKAGGAVSSSVGVAADVAGKGYVIKATAFLFQLDWNEEAAATFYTKYYNEKDLVPFLNDSIFKLKYIGSATEWSDVQSTIFSNASELDLVNRAAVRSLDEVIAKLQKEFEVFRINTPLVTVEPEITAYIGMKEGVKKGSKFEVLEKELDAETGITKYKKVATIEAEKDKIWDNRFAADEEKAELAKQEGKEVETETLKATVFKGNKKNLAPGMLIRQIN